MARFAVPEDKGRVVFDVFKIAKITQWVESMKACRIISLLIVSAGGVMAEGTLWVRHAPVLNGQIEGSVQVMAAEDVTLNGRATVTGDLLVPGLPVVRVNGSAICAGTVDGTGAAAPATHRITLNGSARLGRVVRRTDPFALAVIDLPPMPAGVRSAALSRSGQNPGDFATLRNLTLNGDAGAVAVPAGTYGSFTASSGTSLVLGVAESATPALYDFQSLTLNGSSRLEVVGPVVVVVGGGVVINSGSAVGTGSHPEWLHLRIAAGGLTVNGHSAVYADLEAPAGTVTFNGGSELVGRLASDRLVVNGNSVLHLRGETANQAPDVRLVAPFGGASYGYGSNIHLEARASDLDGTVARVEFFAGATKLGEAAASPFTFDWSSAAPGGYALTARAIDNLGTVGDSAPVTVAVTMRLPFAADFESTEGYVLGPIDGQGGWTAAGASLVTDADAAGGANSVVLPGLAPVAWLRHDFPEPNFGTVLFVDFEALPAAGAGVAQGSVYSVSGASVAVDRVDGEGEFAVLDRSESGVGIWRPTGARIAIDADGRAAAWHRLTIRSDYTSQRWDLYLDGRMVAANCGSADSVEGIVPGFTAVGNPEVTTLLDRFGASFDNPLFTDADRDGLPDTWEQQTGLNPSTNDRDGDPDGDSLSNVQEFLLGTRPDVADTDADGMPDGWEVAHHLDPRHAAGAEDDSDRDGLSDGQEYVAGTDPANADSDGDGMPDGWEVHHGLLPNSSADGSADPDGDGLTNLQEYAGGADPADYYNGAPPELTPLAPSNGQLSPERLVAVGVTRADGTVLVNAPVSFSVIPGTSLMSLAADGANPAAQLGVRTDAAGVARVYLNLVTDGPDIVVVTVQGGAKSASISIRVAPSDLPPVVELTTPVDGSEFMTVSSIVFTATASDPDGTVAKVEFFQGDTKLGEVDRAPFRYVWTGMMAGAYSVTARVTDDAGSVTISAPHLITVVAPPRPRYQTDFEAGEGFMPGLLNNQDEWVNQGGGSAEITTSEAGSGNQSVVLQPASWPADVVRGLPSGAEPDRVVFFDLWAKPVANRDWGATAIFDCSGSRFTLATAAGDTEAEVLAFDLNEGWPFVFTGAFVAVNADGGAAAWHRFTVRQDHDGRRWDLYVDGRMVAADLTFSPSTDLWVEAVGHTGTPVRFDQVSVGATNPLFADGDGDGLDDAWEVDHGLDPNVADRDGDLDNDGLTNLREYLWGTDPEVADTDGDGLLDGWEVDHGYNPLVREMDAVLEADEDHDGLNLVQEARAGTDPCNPDTDGDGLDDSTELAAGLDPLTYDADSDTDGDGISNRDEILNHTDPRDYYNGQTPNVTSSVPEDGSLIDGNLLAVRVTNQAGEALENAPVTFAAQGGRHGFSPTLEYRWISARRSLQVRTDGDGVARVYVVRADELIDPLP